MKKVIVAIFVTLFVATAAVAQVNYTPNADPLLGPHNVNNQGCISCHAPHRAVLEGSTGYLWAVSTIPSKVYKTYGGGTIDTTGTKFMSADSITTSNIAVNDTMMHTVLCLSCHDTALSGMVLSSTNNAVVGTDGTDLGANHPVHVQYPLNDATFWKVTVSNSDPKNPSASFVDSTGAAFGYGHPAKLYSTDGATAYVECGSCHNPHMYKNIVVTQNGSKTAVTTAHFVRGQYGDIASNQNFCVSCHADKSGQWNGTGNQ